MKIFNNMIKKKLYLVTFLIAIFIIPISSIKAWDGIKNIDVFIDDSAFISYGYDFMDDLLELVEIIKNDNYYNFYEKEFEWY